MHIIARRHLRLQRQLKDERAAILHRISLNQPDRAERVCGEMQPRSLAGRSAQVEIRGVAAHHTDGEAKRGRRPGSTATRKGSPARAAPAMPRRPGQSARGKPRACVRELAALPEPQAPAHAQGRLGPAALPRSAAVRGGADGGAWGAWRGS